MAGNTQAPSGMGIWFEPAQAGEDVVLTVRDYGAVGDGVADDTAAIQSAIDDGVAAFPPGAYRLKKGTS